MIYNDAYSQFAGGRHPSLFGSKVREGWPEVADFNDNVMKVGLAGGTLAYRDQALILSRNGTPEQVWMDLDYSPLLDESGKPAGVMAIVIETTEKVRAQKELSSEREGLRRMFEQAPGFIAVVTGPDHTFTMANDAYGKLVGHRSRTTRPDRSGSVARDRRTRLHRFARSGLQIGAAVRGARRESRSAAQPGRQI